MEHLAPVIQTALWTALIAGIAWRFHKSVESLLHAIRERISGGGSIKVGMFEMNELRPQNPEEQKERIKAEIVEDQLQEKLAEKEVVEEVKPKENMNSTALYYQAEDLAIRALQEEYGQPIARQLAFSKDLGFDGVFTVNGAPHFVEVKYSRHDIGALRVQHLIDRTSAAVERSGWKNAVFILVLVTDSDTDSVGISKLLEEKIKNSNIDVRVKKYSLPKLREQFGITNNDVQQDVYGLPPQQEDESARDGR